MRPAAATAVLGVALAVGVPTAWSLTRPPATVGAPVEQVVGTPSTPSSFPATSSSPAPAPSTSRAVPSSSSTPSSSPAPVPPSPAAAPALPPAAGIATRDAAPQVTPAPPAPARLTVPALGVDAAVDAVGVDPDGQMTIPAEVDRVGWYRFGPAPGVPGSAVIAGHVDSRTQGLGAMAPLREASVGDEVQVTDAAGAITRWRVLSRELISKQVLPLELLFSRDGPPRLTLITCGGPFLPEFGSYRDNVVVVAEPIP